VVRTGPAGVGEGEDGSGEGKAGDALKV